MYVSVVPYDFQLHTLTHTHTHTRTLTCTLSHTHTFTLYTHSLLLTTFCLEHRPTVVACVCIHLAATWKGEDFTNLSSQRSNWWEYVDPSVTLEQLNGKELGASTVPATCMCVWCIYNVPKSVLECMLVCASVCVLMSCIWFVGSWPPFIIDLSYDDPPPSCGLQIACKNLGC